MSKLRKAAERALEILENRWADGSQEAIDEWRATADDLREALSQPDIETKVKEKNG